jgi:anti-sigma factor RsiW
LDKNQVVELINRIFATEDVELDCNRTQELLPAYVDADLIGQLSDSQFAMVAAHLAQCPDCTEDCEALRMIVAIDAQADFMELDELLASLAATTAQNSADLPQILAPDHLPNTIHTLPQ